MRVTVTIVDCRDKISPECTKTFIKSTGRGRPAVNCDPCRMVTKIVVSTETHRNCRDCGERFALRVGGKGRKALRCDTCRTSAKVVRTNDERIADTRSATLAVETAEIKEQRGKDRAARLTEMMKPIIRRRTLVNA